MNPMEILTYRITIDLPGVPATSGVTSQFDMQRQKMADFWRERGYPADKVTSNLLAMERAQARKLHDRQESGYLIVRSGTFGVWTERQVLRESSEDRPSYSLSSLLIGSDRLTGEEVTVLETLDGRLNVPKQVTIEPQFGKTRAGDFVRPYGLVALGLLPLDSLPGHVVRHDLSGNVVSDKHQLVDNGAFRDLENQHWRVLLDQRGKPSVLERHFPGGRTELRVSCTFSSASGPPSNVTVELFRPDGETNYKITLELENYHTEATDTEPLDEIVAPGQLVRDMRLGFDSPVAYKWNGALPAISELKQARSVEARNMKAQRNNRQGSSVFGQAPWLLLVIGVSTALLTVMGAAYRSMR